MTSPPKAANPYMGDVQFTPLKDFESPETKSQYLKGFSYTARTDALKRLVQTWVERGLVELGGTSAKLSGRG